MKLKSSILNYSRYFLVVICFLAISSNLYSYYYNVKVKETSEVKKDKKDSKDDDGTDEVRYNAYEAVVPVAHFSVIYTFCFVVKGISIEAPRTIFVTHSPPFFTRPFYKTLFRMIISPNAP